MFALACPAVRLVEWELFRTMSVLANLTHDHPIVYFGAGMTAANVGIALSIDWCVTHSRGLIGSVLNARPLVVVGWLSYSLATCGSSRFSIGPRPLHSRRFR